MFIGVTGTNCSGNIEAVKYLKEKGYATHSLSDILRENARIRGIEPTTDNLVELGNNLRKGGGNDILAKEVVKTIIPLDKLTEIDNERNYTISSKLKAPINGIKAVVESIRNPAEVEYLKNNLQRDIIKRGILQVFYLISMDANIEIRYERFKKRNRADEKLIFKEFEAMDYRSLGFNQEDSGQQMMAVINRSDLRITNDSNAQNDLHKKVDEALKSAKQYRKDVYYMQMALVASSRSDCKKRMLGAIAVNDDRIISTGFNGALSGLSNCNDGGCERCSDDSLPSGVDLDKCRCAHAEENVAGQVSCYGGVGLKGATLYTLLYPCISCAKDIIKAKIERIVYADGYAQGNESEKLFWEYQENRKLQIDHLKL